MQRVAFLTGATGQDGSLLAKSLLDDKYRVVGMVRRTSSPTSWRLQELGIQDHPNFVLCSGDLTDQGSIERILIDHEPEEIYNLGAQSHVGQSWDQSIATYDITGLGAIRVFDAVRNVCANARVYQASSSEMFGGHCRTENFDEQSTFEPQSPYGVAKVCAHLGANQYRVSHDMFISCGILFNHESEWRGEQFVTRKITKAVAEISVGKKKDLTLGNIDSVRDWGYAPDYVEAMRLMLQQDKPDDYVVATGQVHSIRGFLDTAFAVVGIDDWERYVKLGKGRPADVKYLCGNSKKAKSVLGWESKVKFVEMVERMVKKDLERVSCG